MDRRLTLIDRAAEQLGGLIDEVLDFARLEMGTPLELNREPVDLGQLAGRVAAANKHSQTSTNCESNYRQSRL